MIAAGPLLLPDPVLGAAYVLLLSMGVFGIDPAGAQPLPKAPATYQVRTFTLADGLPVGDARYLAQPANGPVYMSTARGLAAFDGYAFHDVPLPGFESHVIETAHLDRTGRLWLLTKENELGYVEDGRFHLMPPLRALERSISNAIHETADGMLWIRSVRGVVRVNPDAQDPYMPLTMVHGLPGDAVRAVTDAPGGRRLVIERDGMAFIAPDASQSAGVRFEPLELPGLPPGSLTRHIWANATGVWVALDDHVRQYRLQEASDASPRALSYTRYDLSDRTPTLHLDSLKLQPGQAVRLPAQLSAHFKLDDPGSSRFSETPRHLLYAGRGTYWFTFLGNGVQTVYRLEEDQVTPFRLQPHLTFTSINNLVLDHEGSLWIGTDRGLVQLAPRAVSALTERSGLAETFTTPVLQTRDGALWVGTWGGGLHRFSDGQLARRYTAADGLPDGRIRSLHESREGTLWVGTGLGAATLQDDQIAARQTGIGEVRDFAETPDGTLWMGTSAQLVRRTPAGQWVKPDSAFWSGRQIWALHAARDGSLWIGSENGLYRYVGHRLYTYGPAEGLQSPFVVAIHEEADGTLWFSTYEDGLHRYQGGRFVAVTAREGLHHNGVWRMLWDVRGGIWMSSDQGVFRVEHARLHAVADALEQGRRPEAPLDPLVFTEAEGLPSRECNRAGPGGWRLADGRLAFNSLRGLALIDPERALTPPPPPHTTLHRLVADGASVEISPSALATVPAGAKQLRFDFAALSFVAPGQNHYRYRLRGYDEAWVDGGTRPTASYTNLPPDEYTFEVQSASGMSAWGPTTAAAFTLRPLLWQTWWFRLLVLGAVVGLLAAAYQYRVRRLLAMERLRLRLASDLHDDVGSNVSSIALISEMLREHARRGGLGPDDREQRQLQRIHAAAEDTVRALRDIIWLVDPKHDTLADLVRKMRRARHTLLNGTSCTFEASAPVAPHPLDMDTMRNVFLLYKEALHNIAKHAGAQHVMIRVDEQDRHLTLQIQDDGHGFDEAAIERGHGLANMRRRARAVGGQIAIDSTPGHGTRITFTAKMA